MIADSTKQIGGKYLYVTDPKPSLNRQYHPSTLAIRPDRFFLAPDSPEESNSSQAETQAPKVCPLRETNF